MDDLGFTYKARKNGEVEILHRGRRATTLRGAAAGHPRNRNREKRES